MTTLSKDASEQAAVADVLRSGATRPPRPNAVASSLSFGWRALLKIKHVPEQLFDVTMFPIMFTLLFTYLFGGALAGSTTAYIQFLLPGILVQTVVMITMYTGVTLNKDIEKGVFDRFRSLPIWRPSPLVGALLGDVVRYSLASVIVLILGLVIGFRPDGGLLGVVASIALLLIFSFCLSWVWTMIAMIVRTEAAVMGVSMFILFPLTFASNIFVDPQTMPGWLRAFVEVNPVSFLVTSIRSLMSGEPDATKLAVTAAMCGGFLLVFGPITMRLYNRKT
ncbi:MULTISPECIES: ABC transporter permease [Nocardiaceae]|jgi:ABC-2 type transport system permease protein|uniref:ABC transporter permease n=1 Tax=Nocardiaceae TaxID=85025 RepID=UPI000382A36D|nr:MULTISPECIES: ABC transporter permease [Rhodococcus]OZC45685.1 ABC transporter permease [Rhodococcus sp. RS1C4]OZC54024.1 ABC transporter permease [Rhodococcus sp. 06-621-2]OZC89420.1 ABC transporter permease [Rhodococcus sp. 06-418-1B]OZD05603.1 ABC transporter permease [Rhodococcus sp. 06-156-4C]OZD16715.1 ABC transporter permease [Rhodococcus sp. 06-156-4a]